MEGNIILLMLNYMINMEWTATKEDYITGDIIIQ